MAARKYVPEQGFEMADGGVGGDCGGLWEEVRGAWSGEGGERGRGEEVRR